MDLQKIEQNIKAAFAKIEHPATRQNLAEMNAFGSLEEDGEKLKLTILTGDENRKEQIELEAKIRTELQNLDLPAKLKIRFQLDTSKVEEDIGNRVAGVKNIIAIGSGKGGVGKSTVSANLAISLSQAGHKVGLIDADIYGPSLGKMFGLVGKQKLEGDSDNSINPHEAYGVKLISFSFMLGMDQAVVWRGPMLGKAIEQFLFQVKWGELDYLILDLPPGTGDVQLSLTQMIDLDGAIIVTTPQNVALQDASRAISMFKDVKVPILGVIENMSAYECPECGHVAHIFSKNGGESIASKYHVPLLGNIPIQKQIMESGEQGTPAVLDKKAPGIAASFSSMHEKIETQIEKYR